MIRRHPGKLTLLAASAAVAAYLALAPDVVSPAGPWTPPPAPTWEGALAPNTALQQVRPLARGQLRAPESVAFDAAGRVYTGTADGRIVRVSVETDTVETFTHTGTRAAGCGEEALAARCGRPLGLWVRADGGLYVADAYRGLLAVSPSGGVRVLTSSAAGVPFRFTDDLAVAADGRVYFSDASDKFDLAHYREDIVENEPRGRLLRYDPATRRTEVLLDRLYFANGVVLAPDERFVLVAETSRYRVRRYWLSGPKAGTADVFADELPGLPDNVRRASDGGYWVALGAKRSAVVDLLHPRPALKRALAKLIPLTLVQRYFVPPVGLVAKLDAEGRVARLLSDPTGEVVRAVSEAHEHGGKLYLGSIASDRISVLDLAN